MNNSEILLKQQTKFLTKVSNFHSARSQQKLFSNFHAKWGKLMREISIPYFFVAFNFYELFFFVPHSFSCQFAISSKRNPPKCDQINLAIFSRCWNSPRFKRIESHVRVIKVWQLSGWTLLLSLLDWKLLPQRSSRRTKRLVHRRLQQIMV